MHFQEILVQLMESRKVTAYKLYKDTGIAQSVIGRWKSGKAAPSLDNLNALSGYFGVSVDYLLGNEKKPAISDDDELSEDEIKLIEQYRAASDELKAAVQRIVKEN